MSLILFLTLLLIISTHLWLGEYPVFLIRLFKMHIQKRVFASFIFALASFILSLLVLTAGSKPGFLEDASIITVGLQVFCFFS